MNTRKVVFINGGSWNGVTSVQVNVITYFLDKGYIIDVILFDTGIPVEQIKYDRWPKSDAINYIVIGRSNMTERVLYQWFFTRVLIKFGKCVRYLRHLKKLYSFDFEAGTVAYISKIFFKTEYTIHSIELYPATAGSLWIKKAFQNATQVITQDAVRAQRLVELYGLKSDAPIRISINSSRARDKVVFDPITFPEYVEERKKILFIGSLIKEHLYPDLIKIAKNIPDHFCLIFHGWGGQAFQKELEELIVLKPKNIFISDVNLPEQHKFSIYSRCDIGLVLFSDQDYNTRNAGLSAGKLFDFMRCGKPIVCNDVEGLNTFVLKLKIGIVVNELTNVFSACNTILDNYSSFSSCALRHFPEFEFDTYYNKIYNEYQDEEELNIDICNSNLSPE